MDLRTGPSWYCGETQAFEALGEHIFGKEWRGYEIEFGQRPRPPDPRELDDRLAWMTGETERLRQLLISAHEFQSACKSTQAADAAERAHNRLKAEYQNHLDELRTLEKIKPKQEQQEAWQRYSVVWNKLIKALKTGELIATTHRGREITQDLLAGSGRMRFYLELSMAILPKCYGSSRRAAILIPKTMFNHWLVSIEPKDENAPFDIAKWCEAQMLAYARSHMAPTKAALLSFLRKKRPELSDKVFKSCWSRVAPKAWRKPGPKKNKLVIESN